MYPPSSRYVRANGLNLHYLEWPGGSPAVMCLPGITANAHAFEGLAEELSPRLRVIAVDLRGRGKSDKPADGYHIAAHVEDAAEVLRSLDIERAVVIGWSLGAKVALALAAIHPQLVERLVLIDPPVETSPEAAAALRGFWARLDSSYESVDEFLARMRSSRVFKRWDPYVERYLRADVYRGPDGYVHHTIPRSVPEKELAAENDYPTRSFYGRVSCSVLLLRAPLPLVREGDQVLGFEQGREMAAALPGCRMIEIEGADHFSILLGKPQLTIDLVVPFVMGG